MNEFTSLEFDEAMAKLAGMKIDAEWHHSSPYDYYNDLNLLMPLAWKHGVQVSPYIVDQDGIKKWIARSRKLENCIDEDPIQAIRECLYTIAMEIEK